jgi:hypothetical protein
VVRLNVFRYWDLSEGFPVVKGDPWGCPRHIGRTVEAYVDDIVVKNRKADDLVGDLGIAFGCLRANGVNLNPE